VIFRAQDWVIRQGEDGDELFFVEEGELDCFKKFKKDEDDKYLKTYKPGESFGELALLYNVPRAASIRSKTDSKLFVLDRDCFNNIIRNAAIKKRQRYEDFLQKVPILQEMDSYERTQLCDIIKPLKCEEGEYIIRQVTQT
jgi:cAMP-dependent protein kinase regulator